MEGCPIEKDGGDESSAQINSAKAKTVVLNNKQRIRYPPYPGPLKFYMAGIVMFRFSRADAER